MTTALKIRYTWSELGYAALLLLILQGNLFVKLAVLSVLLVFNAGKILLVQSRKSVIFYLYILSAILVSFLTVGWLRDINYIYSLIFSLILWTFALFLFNFNDFHIRRNSTQSIKNSLDIVFWLNVFVSLLQLILLMINQRTLNPFSGIYKASTGDYIYGVFSNSSVNMIISSFFFFYYYSHRKHIKSLAAGLVAILTTFMGGIVLSIVTFIVILVLNPAIQIKYKFLGLLLLIVVYLGFNIISPENMRYAKRNIRTTLSDKPPRKITSFKETYAHITSNPWRFLFGSGPGNFSSRTAFVMGGEYVGWIPASLVYRSKEFNENHFQLWNHEILSKPYQDGTANQPFSLYNQLLGEYGLLGLIVFFVFYIGYYVRNYFKLTFGKYLLIFMLLISVMDYWFEYLSIMVLFEIFMLLQLKELNERD